MSNPLTDRLTGTLALEEPVSSVRLVSPARAQALNSLGVFYVRDLVTLFPRRYIDMSAVTTILYARVGTKASIVGTIHRIQLKRPKPKLSLVEIMLTDDSGTMIITAFRQPWLMDKLSQGMRIAVSGDVEFSYGMKRMTNPFIEVVDLNDSSYSGRIIPVHPACAKLSTAWMRNLVGNALDAVLPLHDPLPVELRMKYRLMSRNQALENIHRPRTMDDVHEAKRRLIYEELLFLELLLMQQAAKRDAAFVARQHIVSGEKLLALQASCPFTPTADQALAIDDILKNMAAPKRMNHLLLGDVGTGKTLVAAFALAAATDSGTQSVLMAPTEILATQHFASLTKLFGGVDIRVGLLTGSTSADERATLLERLAAGEIDVLVGTHAVLEEDVRFKDCSLVVIDEQQRFGVAQRATLLQHAPGADALYLTATPIPRTLALSLYGDLTLSYLSEKPTAGAGRSTTVYNWNQVGEAYGAALEALERGEQVYVVCPLVNAAEDQAEKGKAPKKVDLSSDEEETYVYASVSIEQDDDFPDATPSSAVQRRDMLANTVFNGYNVGLLHGKMSGKEKRAVMEDFSAGKIQVLVATTVIEVGIDVHNATVMIIDSADRFGLSQLHQLRGRVGRGSKPGQVFLISGSLAPEAIERLSAMQRTDDGFELATYDLSLRREGDILGNRQSGASALKLVNVVRDAKVIEAAHADARAIIDADPFLEAPEHLSLARELRLVYPDTTAKIGG